MPQRAKRARLADTGLTGEQDVLVLLYGLDEALDDARLGRRKPQGGVRDVFVEGGLFESEVTEPRETAHQAPPFLRPTIASTSGSIGSKGMASMPLVGRGDRERLALPRASTGRSAKLSSSHSTQGAALTAKVRATTTLVPAR